MTSALISAGETAGRPALASDLESVGIQVVGTVDCRNLVQESLRTAPDVIVFYEDHPDDSLFSSMALLRTSAPRPVVVFTTNSDVGTIERATKSGIDVYVINGYGLHRLRSVIHLSQVRFRHEQLLRDELLDITARFEERKLLDRAKGILMRARQISEEDAFKILRTASMQSNLRMGKVSQQVIHAASYAEAVNRAGQLRMLSQRLVSLFALQIAGIDRETHQGLMSDSIARTSSNIAILTKSLSQATFGDLLAQVDTTWKQWQHTMRSGPEAPQLAALDTLSESLLTHAEQLTMALEVAGSMTTLHVINVSGRQRMLSQRLIKQGLLSVLLQGRAATDTRSATLQTIESFEQSLAYLNEIPLSTKFIRSELSRVEAHWKSMRIGLAQVSTAAGRLLLAQSSEALLESFEQLTAQYERSMQMLIG